MYNVSKIKIPGNNDCRKGKHITINISADFCKFFICLNKMGIATIMEFF